MLSEKMIYDALDDAMNMHALLNGGQKGFEKAVLRDAVYARGGSEADLHSAMIAGLKLLLPDDSMYFS